MKTEITVGVVCLVRKTFDFEAALNIYKNIQAQLNEVKYTNWKFILNPIINIEDAQLAAHKLVKEEIDAFICINGTFALGHLILELNKILQKPILLWGLNELPYDGGKIRLNSVCGLNLNASNLYKAGVTNYHVVIGEEVDHDWLDAIRILKTFTTAHLGILGYRAKGFFNLDVDELNLYQEIGVLIDHYELREVFDTPVDDKEVKLREEQLKSLFDISALDEFQLNKLAKLIVKFDEFLNENNLSALAIRCWPEFAEDYGIAPCAAMSVLQSEGKILTCEGDILGSLSMLAQQAIGGKNPFLADFSQVDFKEDYVLLWHCGVAACNLGDSASTRSLDTYFAGGKGITAGFVMKPGEISLARIDYALGEYRLFLQRGEGIPMKKELKGTYLKVIFEKGVKKVLDKIITNGIAHHVSIVYSDIIEPLKIFAKLKNWRVID